MLVVFASGGILAQTGTFGLAAAAKHHAVPVVVLSGLYKLSPRFVSDPKTMNEHKSPSDILEYGNGICSMFTHLSEQHEFSPHRS